MTTYRPTSSQVQSSSNYIWNKLDVLGHGATCEVYKAYHKTSGEPAAVKVFNKGGISRDMYQQQRELQLVKKLEHKNLVKVLAIEEEEHNAARSIVVMELCEGRSLFCFLAMPLNRHGLDDREFLTVLNDVTEGVKYLREMKVVHRDIKPGNIMRCIREDGSSLYKLTDFGGARELADDDVFMSLHGTEEYLHPDMYDKALVDRRSPAVFKAEVDLWSLGATYYHCATGQTPFRPFHGRQDKALMLQMTRDKQTGVISGYQKTKDGPICYSKELPEKSPLSPALKKLMEPILGKLLERDEKEAMNFQEYFDCIDEIKQLVSLNIFNVHSCKVHKLMLTHECSFSELKNIIKESTGIFSDDQFLLTERYIDLEHLENDFLKYNQVYVLSEKEGIMTDTEYSVNLPDSNFSKTITDLLSYDHSLAYAMCVESNTYQRELKKCYLHCELGTNAIQSIVDYCEDNPNRLKINMTTLNERSLNLENRRRDILCTNEAFISIIELLTSIFQRLDPNSINTISKLSTTTLMKLKSTLTQKVMNEICNKLQLPHADNFEKMMDLMSVIELRHVIKGMYDVQDQGLKDFLSSCLSKEVPITYVLSILELTKTNLTQWAKQKVNSGSNIDEQLKALMSKIVEIQKSNVVADNSIEQIMNRMNELCNIMTNVLTKMSKIQQQFEAEKKQKPPLKVTTTVRLMHQLHRSYLETLKGRAKDVTIEAAQLCNDTNKCLKPRLEGFLSLQETLRKYKKEYEQDVDMFSEHESTMEQWRTLIYDSFSELGKQVHGISIPQVESASVKAELLAAMDRFEQINLRNKRLCNENSEILQQILLSWTPEIEY